LRSGAAISLKSDSKSRAGGKKSLQNEDKDMMRFKTIKEILFLLLVWPVLGNAINCELEYGGNYESKFTLFYI
jgi:hypothetical protein